MIEAIEHKQLKWQHITNPTEEDYDYLLETYEFHPLDIEDCKSNNQRPKIDEYNNYYFLILHFPYFEKDGKSIRVREVKIFWGKDYIITIGKPHWAVKQYFDDLRQDIAQHDEDAQEAMGCSDLLLYNILNRLMPPLSNMCSTRSWGLNVVLSRMMLRRVIEMPSMMLRARLLKIS